jgi:dephospho-CoA kinase
LRVGLTGGIACGKSHVLARLNQAGFATLDLDVLAHEVMAPGGSAYEDVVGAFGPEILAADGTIDRKALGERVFANPELRARLNELVHPRVREEEARRAREVAESSAGVMVTDAALLVEAGVHLRFDRLVVVHCPAREQVRRLMARSGLDEAAARARVESQMPTDRKRLFAHFEVESSGSFEETDRAVDALVRELRVLAATPPDPVSVPIERSLACLHSGPSVGAGGIAPSRLLKEIAETGGVEMERLARLVEPPRPGPWYELARDSVGPGPETLMAPVVLWALGRRGIDPPFLLAAAASLARLTHTSPASIAGGCLFALALQELATGGPEAAFEERLEEWLALAERWGGAPPSPQVLAAIHEADRPAGATAVDPELIAALEALGRPR